jgi:hypothetical protein
MEYDSLDGILYRIRALVKTTLMSRFSMSFITITLHPIIADRQKKFTSVPEIAGTNTTCHTETQKIRRPPTKTRTTNRPPLKNPRLSIRSGYSTLARTRTLSVPKP